MAVDDRVTQLYRRMVLFGANSIRIADSLPETPGAGVIARQLCRSSTSIGANYREAQRSRTKTEFTSKLQIALGEADESVHWSETLAETGYIAPAIVQAHLAEANELTAILVTSVRSAKRNG